MVGHLDEALHGVAQDAGAMMEPAPWQNCEWCKKPTAPEEGGWYNDGHGDIWLCNDCADDEED